MRRLAFCLTLILLVMASGPAWMQESISPIPADALEVLVRARSDLELLATNQLGGVRPAEWNASLDVSNPQLAVLIRLDLELLAAYLVSLDTRPDGWFGAIPGTAFSIARDIRHDLELLADTVIATNQRPAEWAGDDPLMRCDRSTQNLIVLLERSGMYSPITSPERVDYCDAVAVEINQYVETNYPNGLPTQPQTGIPGADPMAAATMPTAADTYFADGSSAIAFLDRYATQRVGTIPADEPLQVLARSYTQFSRMILVQGADFLVFVDYRTTSLPQAVFDDLPDINTGVYDTVCDADWCQAVVRTTGIGGGSAGGPGGRQLVSPSTNMVIYYDGGDTNGTTLVRMELCDQPTSTGGACQPVTTVVGPDGAPLPAAGSLGGLSQFRLPYGYSTYSARSQNYYTADIWINIP